MEPNQAMDAGAMQTFDDARAQMNQLLRGQMSETAMADWLTSLHQRGETAVELAGFADAMRAAAVTLPLADTERTLLVDTCGTGGDGSGTFNISTAVALLACAAGVRIAKHGNRAVTSRCGSADVLAALGVRTDHTPDSAVAALRRDNFVFLLATSMHPAMRVVAHVRRTLPFRTVFNLLGPMTNPAGARRQVLGVYSAAAVPLVAQALALGGHVDHALVVHGAGGLDELSLRGESVVAEVRRGDVRQYAVRPRDAGLAESDDALAGGDALQNAAILQAIFAGEHGPRRDVVLLNAAAVLMVVGRADNLQQGVHLAARAIDTGAVTAMLERIRTDG